jgi:hypothetical protein
MSKVNYKEFTKEEEKIYDSAIEEIRSNLKKGMKFEDACSSVKVDNDELKLIVLEDFLKITVAEMHYTSRKTFEEIAEELDIPLQSVALTHKRMLDDIMNTQKGNLGLDDPETLGLSKPHGNA